jgi:(1->4)-alpha-D-glucan 1-alpha-D-glucosylmutase
MTAADTLPALSTALIPRATYRIQFHAGMRFEEATRRVPYLQALGISHLYASPYLKARAGSTHGYDIVDHHSLNPEIGNDADHAALCHALAQHGMQQLLDIVPNHMGVLEADNAWWLDVLECGPASAHAHTFDIEWQAAVPELRGRVLLPVLGDHYGRVLEAGELKLAFDGDAGEFALRYYDHRLPIDPRRYPEILAAAGALPQQGVAPRDAMEVQSLFESFARLAPIDSTDEAACEARRRDKPLLKRRLAQQHALHGWLRDGIDAALAALNGRAGDAASFDALDALIGQQAWRLSYWLVAGDDINYRRFFDVNTLAALRMERPEVFEATHRAVLRWLAEGKLHGLRVDHPDGLCDPQQYLERLQAAYVAAQRAAGREPRALYLAIEKILAEHEHLSADWPTHGDTGYRFSNVVHGVFVDGRNEAAFDALYEALTDRRERFGRQLYDAKRLIMTTSLAADLQILTLALHRIAAADRRTRDFTRNRLRAALIEVAAGFPVYRTYIGERGVSDVDRQHVEWAVAAARRSGAAWEVSAIGFVHDVLLGAPDEPDERLRRMKLDFVARWQQFTSPVMAKSMEDTAFYRYHRLVCLNDVGGDPQRFGLSVSGFHAANASRGRFHPHAMLGTSTHDSKRSEDVRARLAVLSEMPGEWEAAVRRWSAINLQRALRSDAEIDANDEYLLYQTLVGVWPLEPVDAAALDGIRRRVQAYMQKALREGKEATSWINPNAEYEASIAQFIDLLLGVRDPNPFLTDFEAFVRPLSLLGCANSLNQVAFKLTVPGVPDIYQGCEEWNFSLVDPDNRRPVDFDRLAGDLEALQADWVDDGLTESALDFFADHQDDPRSKLLVTWRLLTLRREKPRLFECASYEALEAGGPPAHRLVAYARAEGNDVCVVIGSRLPRATQSEGGWQDGIVRLAGVPWTTWRDVLTGSYIEAREEDGASVVDVERAFATLPVAVLVPAGIDPLREPTGDR